MHVDVLKDTLHSVLIGQPEGHYLELQLADGTQDHVGIAQRPEQLRGALLAQLCQTFGQRLHPQRILEHGATEHFWREIGNAREHQRLALAERCRRC